MRKLTLSLFVVFFFGTDHRLLSKHRKPLWKQREAVDPVLHDQPLKHHFTSLKQTLFSYN